MSESSHSTNGATTDYEFLQGFKLKLYTFYKDNEITNKDSVRIRFRTQRNAVVQFGAQHPELYNSPYFNDTTIPRERRFRHRVNDYMREMLEGFNTDRNQYYKQELVAEMERMYQAQAALRREREIQHEPMETEEVESELDDNEETSVNSDHNNNETETEDGQESLSSSSEPDMEQNQQNQPAPESPATQQTENAIPGSETFECDCNAQSTACSYHACSECLKQVERVIQLSQSQRSMPAEITIHIHFHEAPAAASYTKYIVFWFIVIVFIVYGYNVFFGAYEATNLIGM
jgi:hypothetical protein